MPKQHKKLSKTAFKLQPGLDAGALGGLLPAGAVGGLPDFYDAFQYQM